MRRTTIYLDERQTDAVARVAVARGVSRAEVIREFIDRGLDGAPDLAADLSAIEEAFGGAPGFEWVARERSGRERHLAEVDA